MRKDKSITIRLLNDFVKFHAIHICILQKLYIRSNNPLSKSPTILIDKDVFCFSLYLSLFFFLSKVWIGKNQCKENASRIIDVVCTLQYQSKRFMKGVILIPFILKEHIEVPIRPFFKLYQQKELYLCDHSRDYCIMHACIIWGICRRIRFILGFSSIHIRGILLSFW